MRGFTTLDSVKRIKNMPNEVSNQLRAAKNRVSEYEDWTKHHAQVTECRDLEGFLVLAIEAFDWIERADASLRSDIALESLSRECENESCELINKLCRDWLVPCQFAEEWIVRVQGMGFCVDNVDRFHECSKQMVSVVAAQGVSTREMAGSLVELEGAALKEHTDGETAEFF